MSKEQRNKAYAFHQNFDYLPDRDRFLLKRSDSRYRFNVIGTGVNGQEHILVTYLEGRADIHGIYDPNPSSVAAAQRVHRQFVKDRDLVVYDSLEAACYDPAVDGLIISTPNYTHIEVVRVAAGSTKHILLEKPIATNIADALAICDIASRHPAVFQLGLQYRYKAIYAEAIHEALVRKSLGEIKTLSLMEHRMPFLDKVNQWNKFSRYSGDTLIEKCCHYFDLLNLFAQARPKQVFASGGRAVNFQDFEYDGEKSDILDHALVTITYANGVQARFDLCMFAPMFYEELIICADEGRLKACENEDSLTHSDKKNYLEIKTGEHRPSRLIVPTYPEMIESSGHNGATYYEHVGFIDNIEGKKTQTATTDDGLWSIIIAAAAQQSIKTGRIIDIEEFLVENNVEI